LRYRPSRTSDRVALVRCRSARSTMPVTLWPRGCPLRGESAGVPPAQQRGERPPRRAAGCCPATQPGSREAPELLRALTIAVCPSRRPASWILP
jgi:hypothetical protein